MILIYYKKEKMQKVLALIEQFMLKEDDIYRQSKIPSLMLIKLKIHINFYHEA